MAQTGLKPRSSLDSPHRVTSVRAIALAIVFFAFALRVFRLGAVGLDYDEGFSIHAASMNLAGILYIVSTFEPHPPLYYSFLHFWYPLAGASEVALRFPSVAANVLTVVLLVRVAGLFRWRAAGLVGAALLALNPYQVWYSQDARMYAPVALFGIAAVYLAVRAVRDGRKRFFAAYALCMLLGLYTHYYAIFLAVFINVFAIALILAEPNRRTALRRWLGAQVAVGALYLPWLAYAYRISLGYTRPTVDPSGMLGVIGQALAEYSLGTTLPSQTAFALALGFLAVIGFGLWSIRRGDPREPAWHRYLFAAGYLLMPLALGLVVSFFRSMFLPRYFMVSAPAFFLLLGLGVVGLYRRSRPLALVVGSFLVATQLFSLRSYFEDPAYNKSEVAVALGYVGKHLGQDPAVILDGWSQATQFWYYHDLRGIEPAPGYVLPLSGADGWDLTFPRIDEIMAEHHGVWLLTYGVLEVDAQHLIETYLAENYYQVTSRPIIDNRVFYYASPPPVAPTITSLSDVCNQEILLKDVQSYGASVRAGDVVPLALRWQALTSKTRDYVVSWRLLDAQGHTVVQRDSEPASGFSPSSTWTPGEDVMDRYGMLIPTVLPPGKYAVEIVVFDKASGAVCAFQHDGKAVPGTLIPLTSITVRDAPPAPAIEDPSPSHLAHRDFGGLTLLGYDLGPGPYQPGDEISLRLFWKVTGTPTNPSARARLVDDGGAVLADQPVELGPPEFPASRWQPGRTVATYLDVTVPAQASTGSYHLSLTLSGDGLAAETLSDFPAVPIVARPRSFNVPRIPHPRTADFGGLIGLLGYDLRPASSGEVTPGQPMRLTLYWRDERPIRNDYKVFTHLVGPDGKIYGQDDDVPLGGDAPTTGWVPGEVLVDRYDLDVKPDAPDGRYQLVVGFYDPDTGARIPLTGGTGDSLVVATLVASD